jgi:hypothetical protein
MDWLRYFRQNRANRLPIRWELGINVEPHLQGPLVRSLQRFQVGEQGDGAHLKQAAAKTSDPEYAETIKLFLEEEQEHSRLLARILEGMGAPLLKSHWTDRCFIAVRHLMGLRMELMVLLAAELIAKPYYRTLHAGTRDPVVKAVCAQILRDEEGHVAFHWDYLARSFAGLPVAARLLILLAWSIFYRAVCLVVIYDHRSVLRAAGVPPVTFWRDCGAVFEEAAAHIFVPASTVEQAAVE